VNPWQRDSAWSDQLSRTGFSQYLLTASGDACPSVNEPRVSRCPSRIIDSRDVDEGTATRRRFTTVEEAVLAVLERSGVTEPAHDLESHTASGVCHHPAHVGNSPAEDSQEMVHGLVAFWPSYLAYVLSSILIGRIRANHHVVFDHVHSKRPATSRTARRRWSLEERRRDTNHCRLRHHVRANNVLCTNLLTPLELSRRVLDGMLARRRGAVVNISSFGGEVALRNCVPYSASKSGLTLATQVMQRELRGTGVNAQLVVLGTVATDMFDDARQQLVGRAIADRFNKLPAVALSEVGTRVADLVENERSAIVLPGLGTPLHAIRSLPSRLFDLALIGTPGSYQ
jgi:NAD(P)-dependent dehydrogenase (short-subunit alcohol dehydrogenase family)